jgi:isopentenyl phosphate kinase
LRPLIFLKLGGSLITDKSTPFTERRDVIRSLASEIREALVETGSRLLLGHGSGSYAHTPAAMYRTHQGLVSRDSVEGWARVQDAASRLNRIVLAALLEAGVYAVSVQPSAAAVARKGRIVSWDTFIIEYLLENGITPVVYGDVVVDLQQGCSIVSTEEIFRFLSLRLRPSRVIVATDVDGVYTGDPKADPSSRKLDLIDHSTFERVFGYLRRPGGFDVTGGMAAKVSTLLEICEQTGAECEIIGGRKRGNVAQAMKGVRGLGTIIRWA